METLEDCQTSIRVPYLTDEQIANAASRLRADYVAAGGADSVAINPENLIWDFLDGRDRLSLDTEGSLGITREGDQIAGAMSVLPDGGLIRIDGTVLQSALYPFTLAHEVGHWVLHKACILAANLMNSPKSLPRRVTTSPSLAASTLKSGVPHKHDRK